MPCVNEILAFLAGRAATWWGPDEVVLFDALPAGATGEVQKGDLRKQYSTVFG